MSNLDRERQHRGGLQVSLAMLLVGMAWIGVVCVALRDPSLFWLGILKGAMSLALLTAVLLIAYRTGATRAFSVGFLLFGCFYYMIPASFLPVHVPTEPVADWLYRLIHWEAWMRLNRDFTVEDIGHQRRFREVVALGTATLLALLGGVVARAVYATRQETSSERECR